jgi:peroxiredoxin
VNFKRALAQWLGGKRMGALTAGKSAPAISLKTTDGQRLSLADALKRGPVLAAFFKVNCPTCQFTMPFIERISAAYSGQNFTVMGISQNDAADSKDFMQHFGVKFPVLIDDSGYPISNRYGLTNVPTLFLISSDGKIQSTSVGFTKADIQTIAAEAARANGKSATPLFKPGEVVPEHKPG